MGAVFRLGYAEVSLFETYEPGFSDGEGAGTRGTKLPHPCAQEESTVNKS